MDTPFKRMFSPKKIQTVVSVTKSIRIPEIMWKIIEELASQQGATANSYVVLVLDQFLQTQKEQGKIPIDNLEERMKASGL